MNRYFSLSACLAVATLVGGPALAQNRPASASPAPSSSQATASTSRVPSSTSSGQQSSSQARKAASESSALMALQDARVTLSRLTEASVPTDVRDSLSQVSSDFRGLYKAYTGEEPEPKESASQAAAAGTHAPDSTWSNRYAALRETINRMIASDRSSSSTPVGTSGSATAAPTGDATHLDLAVPVRKDLVLLRDQIDRFNTAAGRTSAPASGTSQSSTPVR
jgi:hypothetical protein